MLHLRYNVVYCKPLNFRGLEVSEIGLLGSVGVEIFVPLMFTFDTAFAKIKGFTALKLISNLQQGHDAQLGNFFLTYLNGKLFCRIHIQSLIQSLTILL
jgi:hypothetical protein